MTAASTSGPKIAMSGTELFRRGLAAHQCGQLQDAAEMYRQALRISPKHADSSHLLGVVAYQSGQAGVAIEHIRRAIALDPAQAHYHFNLGLSLFAIDRTDEAIGAFDAALCLRADYPEYITILVMRSSNKDVCGKRRSAIAGHSGIVPIMLRHTTILEIACAILGNPIVRRQRFAGPCGSRRTPRKCTITSAWR